MPIENGRSAYGLLRFSLWFSCLIAILAAWFGCADKPAARSIPPPTPPPQFSIHAAREVTSDPAAGESTRENSTWEIRVAQFHDHQIEQLGLKELFDLPLSKARSPGFRGDGIHSFEPANAVADPTLAGNPLFELARQETNVSLSIRRSPHVGICSSGASSNLIQNLTASAGVDLLTPPMVALRGTNQAQVTVQDRLTLIIPSARNGGRPRATALDVGPAFDLRLLGQKHGADLLQFTGRFEQFKGYSHTAASGATNVHPILDLALFATTTELRPTETLLLASGVDTAVQQTIDRIPYLSDLPWIGQLFVKRSVQTNYLRQIVIVRRRD